MCYRLRHTSSNDTARSILLQPNIEKSAHQITDAGRHGDNFGIGEKVDFLDSHGGHSGSRADTEHAAPHPCRIGQKKPKRMIHSISSKIIHSHSRPDKGYVAVYGRNGTDTDSDQIRIFYMDIEPVCN